ncbi:hypothetical protein LTR84_007112 [Exophiala bonariae]|uniref:Postreplication repair E3 ubiquitin-protein ligase RAD18 n=1 Tax=Exophiala bonariae TaxID=1690606 RepID=A0AAV9N296_9EURO|nr:hypothetical protein LTR84_007112 [Exophiala bonariae]
MPEPIDITDSTDWLPTPLNPLAQLESSLRCQVCKDFFTTPMMTSCSHTFCSLCIRRYLSQEGKCPACRESDQEIKLRRNWVVEELVTNFKTSRPGLLEFAQKAARSQTDDQGEIERPLKRRKVEQPTTNGTERRSTRSQSKRTLTPNEQDGSGSIPEVIADSEEEGSEYDDAAVGSVGSPPSHPSAKEPNDGRVACPCCHRRMKESLINSHLDKCIAGESSTPIEEKSNPALQLATPGSIAYSLPKPSSNQQARLPFLNYSLLNDAALRKKLRELGIPNGGTQTHMRRRHMEWVNLWNANCDSTSPVAKQQLLKYLKNWEDSLTKQADRGLVPSSGFMAKDFDREGHLKKQKDNFNDLIRQARQKRLVQKQAQSHKVENDADDENGGSPSNAQVVNSYHHEDTRQQNALDITTSQPMHSPYDLKPPPLAGKLPQHAASSNISTQNHHFSVDELPNHDGLSIQPPAAPEWQRERDDV